VKKLVGSDELSKPYLHVGYPILVLISLLLHHNIKTNKIQDIAFHCQSRLQGEAKGPGLPVWDWPPFGRRI